MPSLKHKALHFKINHKCFVKATSKFKRSTLPVPFLLEARVVTVAAIPDVMWWANFMLLSRLHSSVWLPLTQWERAGEWEIREDKPEIQLDVSESKAFGCFYNTGWNMKGMPQTKDNEKERSIQKEWRVLDDNWFWIASKRNANSSKFKEWDIHDTSVHSSESLRAAC